MWLSHADLTQYPPTLHPALLCEGEKTVALNHTVILFATKKQIYKAFEN